ncbi:MAG TPA: hypothetical protein VJ827_01815 [Rubrobacter sp.]|nr:hypothetical protein [Rubrobacter sp.]
MLSYPLDLSFKIVTIGTRIRVTDATGRQVAYARKKKFKLKEDVRVYEDEDQTRLLFRMKADRMIDFSARYAISGPDGHHIGAVGRQGMKSLWSSSYVLADASSELVGSIREENAWVKVLDGLMEAVPFGDAFGGLFFNPAYLADLRGHEVLRVQKQRSVLESSFHIEKLADFSEDEEDLLLAGIIMMVLLERDRG